MCTSRPKTRALINDPVLLADEPTGNLDEETAGSVIDLLTGGPNPRNDLVLAPHHLYGLVEADITQNSVA